MSGIPTELNWLEAPRFDEPACPFCDIARGRAPAEVVFTWPESMAIKPLQPVVPGHLLVIPFAHVRDLVEDPVVSVSLLHRVIEVAEHVMSHASYKAFDWSPDVNIITSIGEAATQTVFHLHIHVVPRRVGDGLKLPWS